MAFASGGCAKRRARKEAEARRWTPVEFKDPRLERAIRETLRLPKGRLYRADLEFLTALKVDGWYLEDLGGLEQCTELTLLEIGWNPDIKDISAIGKLEKLTELNMKNLYIGDISPLAGLTNLRKLYIGNNELKSVAALRGMKELEYLDMAYNEVSDLRPLRGLRNLEYLDARRNSIGDISPLRGLARLAYLNISYNKVSDLSPLTYNANLGGLGPGDEVTIFGNPWSKQSLTKLVPELEGKKVRVIAEPGQI